MKPYRGSSGDAGVSAYEYGSSWIRLQFVGGKVYEYTAGSVGPTNLKTMKRLADDGEGLTTFINTHPEVKDGYI